MIYFDSGFLIQSSDSFIWNLLHGFVFAYHFELKMMFEALFLSGQVEILFIGNIQYFEIKKFLI